MLAFLGLKPAQYIFSLPYVLLVELFSWIKTWYYMVMAIKGIWLKSTKPRSITLGFAKSDDKKNKQWKHAKTK
jgi:hypothetical protein